MKLRFTLGFIGSVAFVAVACGGSTFVVGGDAGSSDGDGGGSSSGSGSSSGGALDSSTGDDASTACVTLPPNTGGEQQFCEDEQYIYTKCGNCEQCRKDNLLNCRTLGDVLSDGFKKALHDCRDNNICGDYTTYASSTCVRSEFAQSTPTSAQRDAKSQYCDQCPQNAGECEHFFDLGGDAGVASTSGIGQYVLMASDAIVDTMTAGCGGSAPTGPAFGCSAAAYLACTGGKLCAAAPADKCKSGLCGK